MRDALIQARDCAQFVARDLRDALGKSYPVESLVILPLIAEAETLRQKIEALIEAVGSEVNQ